MRKNKNRVTDRLGFTKTNYILLTIAIAVVIIGFLVMRYAKTVYGDITISPILLTIAYVVLIPLAIMYKKKDVDE
ncbi:MAG: hypothetical protein B6226_04375 [Candidatus Cloacimonetes bacterium 4572_65]|nr:MAG: hypothetical protein B6226_04375 [Candidatus Cloacimonetes bacterium 4572_65]